MVSVVALNEGAGLAKRQGHQFEAHAARSLASRARCRAPSSRAHLSETRPLDEQKGQGNLRPSSLLW